MKKKKRKWIAGLLAFGLLAGCQKPVQKQADTLVYASQDYTRIDPIVDEHGEINLLLFDGLTAHDENNAVVPALATSWTYDEAAQTWTFHLRNDVTWHDGEPFSAEDVKFTIEAIMDPDNESENAANFMDVESIETPDGQTVIFKLAEPNVAFIDYMSIPILPKHCLEGEDMQTSDFFRHPVGTGPYALEAWETGQAITMRANDAYFAGEPNIKNVVFKIVPDSNARALQLRGGEVDLAQLAPKDAKGFTDMEGFDVYDMKTADYRGILYNFNNPYWHQNKDIIPAISYAIDRDAIVQSVLLGQGEAAYSPIQKNEYNDEGMERFDYDPQKSEALLQEAGCVKNEDGFYERDGEIIGFTLVAPADDSVRQDIARIVAQQLNDVGIDCSIDVPAQVDWSKQMAYVIGWGSPFDADDHTFKVFGSGQAANYASYTNADVDRYLQAARSSADPAARKVAYASFLQALTQDPAFTFICYVDADYVADSRVRGIVPEQVLGHHGVGIFQNIEQWTIS